MKRYLLFAYFDYYPSGGWEDYIGSFDTVSEAVSKIDWGDNWHIVDTVTETIILRKGEG